MEQRQLGSSDLSVSAIGLGTMTFGEQNSEREAFAQLDRALALGVNFVDTAEMYPVPPREATYGETEAIIGRWLKARGNRDAVVLASKAAGPGEHVKWIRGGRSVHDRTHLTRALEDSLRRLETDYIDLYQLHWPARPANFFGQLGYKPAREEPPVNIEESLSVLGELVEAGKVRAIGVSNETPWGVMQFLETAQALGLPKIVSIQNPYSFLNRSFEIGLAEIALRESVPLLAYSPLGFGMLTGKYLRDPDAPGRLTAFRHFQRYSSELARAATAEYVALAEAHGIAPAQLALAFVCSRPFCASTIIGATTLEQLEENVGAGTLDLPRDVQKAIDGIHARYPVPCP